MRGPDGAKNGVAVKTALKLMVGVGLLYFLLQRVEMQRVLSLMAQVAPAPLLVAFAVKLTGVLSHVSRWQLLLRASGVTLKRLDLLRITLTSRFINLFLPGQIGGDVYRAMGVHRHTADLLQSTGIILMERYLSLVATLLMAGAAIASSGFTATAPALSYLVLALLGGALLAAFPPANRRGVRLLQSWLTTIGVPQPWKERLTRGHEALNAMVSTPRLLFKFILLCLAMNCATILQIYLLGQALGLAIPLAQLAFFMPLYNIACAVPVSINALGVREASLVAFFTRMGLPQEEVTGLALLLLIWLYLTDVPNGLLLLYRQPSTSRPPEERPGLPGADREG